MSTESTPYTQPIDLWRLRFDKGYYEDIKADILLRLFLRAELQKLLFEEYDNQILYGEGWGTPELSGISLNLGPIEPYIPKENNVLSPGVLGTED